MNLNHPTLTVRNGDALDWPVFEGLKAFLSSLDIPDHEVLVIWIAFRVGIFCVFS